MKNTRKKISSNDAWDKRELGSSAKHVQKVSSKREKALDEHLGLQTISIRLQKSLIADLKKLAKDDGIGYQPYIRQLLMQHVRHVDHERKVQLRHEKNRLSTR